MLYTEPTNGIDLVLTWDQ